MVDDEKTSAAGGEVTIEGAIGKEEVARRGRVRVRVEKGLAPAGGWFNEVRAE